MTLSSISPCKRYSWSPYKNTWVYLPSFPDPTWWNLSAIAIE